MPKPYLLIKLVVAVDLDKASAGSGVESISLAVLQLADRLLDQVNLAPRKKAAGVSAFVISSGAAPLPPSRMTHFLVST